MAKARVARCPNCGHDRETKAQPRTVLRCPNCSEHYLAPPLSAPAEPAPGGGQDPDPAPGDPLPVATDQEMADAGLLGPEVVKVDAITFPATDPHPAAAGTDPPPMAGTPPPTPETVVSAPGPLPVEPPTPAPPPVVPPGPAEDRPPRRRRRTYSGRW